MARLINNADAQMSPYIINGFISGGGTPEPPVESKFLRFTNTGEDEATIAFSDSSNTGTVLKYRWSVDDEFTDWDFSSLSMQPGEWVEIVGDNRDANGVLGKFSMTGTIAASGSIMYLIYGENMTDEEEIVIPPYIKFGSYYNGMFYNCSSLITPPELPATILSGECYYYMFANCTGLITIPELPATILSDGCYKMMFRGCTSLVNPPLLKADILTDYCYDQMFSGCFIDKLVCLATNIDANNCLYNILYNDNPTVGILYVANQSMVSNFESKLSTMGANNWTIEPY